MKLRGWVKMTLVRMLPEPEFVGELTPVSTDMPDHGLASDAPPCPAFPNVKITIGPMRSEQAVVDEALAFAKAIGMTGIHIRGRMMTEAARQDLGRIEDALEPAEASA